MLPSMSSRKSRFLVSVSWYQLTYNDNSETKHFETKVDFMDPPYFLFLGPVYLVPLFTKTALSRDIAISLNSGDESNQEKLGFLRHPWANSGPQYGILTGRVCILRISNCFIPYSILSLPKYGPNLAKLQVSGSHSRRHFSKKCYFIDPT